MISTLDWDSSFFGIRIGKASISSQDELDRILSLKNDLREKYDLIYVLSEPGLSFPTCEVSFSDTRVVYSALLSVPVSKPSNLHIFEYTSQNVSNELQELALASGVYSRFRLDSKFPPQSYERLYSRWIDQSVKHIMATEVFCYMNDNKTLGFVTLHRKGDTGDIGLLATSKESRRSGIGSTLLKFVRDYAVAKGCASLSVATQERNTAACGLYEKAGFSIMSKTAIRHWWL